MTLLPEVLPAGKQGMSMRPNPGSPMAVERCVLMLWLVLCHALVEHLSGHIRFVLSEKFSPAHSYFNRPCHHLIQGLPTPRLGMK
jgi:hypothetical protein